MTNALHLPLLDLRVGDRVESAKPWFDDGASLAGTVTEVYLPNAKRNAQCPVVPRYRVEWDRVEGERSSGYYLRRDLRPLS